MNAAMFYQASCLNLYASAASLYMECPPNRAGNMSC